VLYSLSGINNERLEILAQEKIFTNTLNFVSAVTDDIIYSNKRINRKSVFYSSFLLWMYDLKTSESTDYR
jgi:hypothetical protein